jgi:hypothetical protein
MLWRGVSIGRNKVRVIGETKKSENVEPIESKWLIVPPILMAIAAVQGVQYGRRVRRRLA